MGVVHGVEIRRVSLPTFFDITSNASLLLDCDYVYTENDLKLVVRWFFNNTPEPVYQWIPERNSRHISNFLKASFDESYAANPNDPYTKFRAIRIRNPTPDLSGKYICDISSLASQDKREAIVFIYGNYFQFQCQIKETYKKLFTYTISREKLSLFLLHLLSSSSRLRLSITHLLSFFLTRQLNFL